MFSDWYACMLVLVTVLVAGSVLATVAPDVGLLSVLDEVATSVLARPFTRVSVDESCGNNCT